ncbi:MAG TPA: hypothetical protein VGH19_12950 [Verrucomicrobiae bacterium]
MESLPNSASCDVKLLTGGVRRANSAFSLKNGQGESHSIFN